MYTITANHALNTFERTINDRDVAMAMCSQLHKDKFKDIRVNGELVPVEVLEYSN